MDWYTKGDLGKFPRLFQGGKPDPLGKMGLSRRSRKKLTRKENTYPLAPTRQDAQMDFPELTEFSGRGQAFH